MNRLKSFSAFALTFTMLAVGAVGCGGDESGNSSSGDSSGATGDVYPENGLPKNEKVTLKFGYWENGYGREWIDKAIESFTKKYPNVKFDVTYSPKINTVISTKVAANNDDDMFDIISPSFTGGDNEKTSLILAGKFEPLDDLWEREIPDTPGKKLKEMLIDGAYENQRRYGGKTYELPMGGYATGLFFDKAFFEKNGWNQNPQTWDQFVQLLSDIKADGVVPLTFPGIYATYLDYGFALKRFELAEINGTLNKSLDDFKNQRLPNYLAPENVEVFKRLSELGKKGFFPQGVSALTHTQSQMQILQHKAAIVFTGDWVQNEMKDSIPEGFKWGFMVIPFGTKPEQTKWIQNGTGSGGMMVWSKKPELNKKWAKEFNLWLFTNDVQVFNNKNAGILPIRKDFADDPKRLEQMQDAPRSVLEYTKANKTRFETLQKDVVLDPHPAHAQMAKVYKEQLPDVALGNKDPAAFLEELEKLFKEGLDGQPKK